MVSSIRAAAVIDWVILQMNAQTLFALIAMGWGISPVSAPKTPAVVSAKRRLTWRGFATFHGISLPPCTIVWIRVRIKQPIPSYLRFGKFLVGLSHDGQQHTCRHCNRGGHFANECNNTVCFHCDELGHDSCSCEHVPRCCISSEENNARLCPYSKYGKPVVSDPGPAPRQDRQTKRVAECVYVLLEPINDDAPPSAGTVEAQFGE